MLAIPIANYVHEHTLTRQQRYDWAIFDTFDMLFPQYDQPRTQQKIEGALSVAEWWNSSGCPILESISSERKAREARSDDASEMNRFSGRSWNCTLL